MVAGKNPEEKSATHRQYGTTKLVKVCKTIEHELTEDRRKNVAVAEEEGRTDRKKEGWMSY